MTLEKILTIYWSQTVLLIGALGVIIKIVLDFKIKKREINHGILQKNRMDALNRFFLAYAEARNMLRSLPIFQKINNGPSTNLDEFINPRIDKLSASIIELELYFEGKLYKSFKKIEHNMSKISGSYYIYGDEDDDKVISEKKRIYENLKDLIIAENDDNIKIIVDEISKKYR